jgi:hypothetical protein
LFGGNKQCIVLDNNVDGEILRNLGREDLEMNTTDKLRNPIQSIETYLNVLLDGIHWTDEIVD